MLCLLTEYSDFNAYNEIGSTLEQYIGENNTQDTADNIAQEIERALTARGTFQGDDIEVDVIPISATELLIKLAIYNSITGETDITLKFDLDNLGATLVTSE